MVLEKTQHFNIYSIKKVYNAELFILSITEQTSCSQSKTGFESGEVAGSATYKQRETV